MPSASDNRTQMEHVNGSVNGDLNGSVNRVHQSNGSMNISMNRSVNGSVNGGMNGSVNGSMNRMHHSNETVPLERSALSVNQSVNVKARNNKRRKRSGLAFLRRRWTCVEIVTTVAMFWEMFGWGLFLGLFGPTLLDLQLVTGATTSQMGFMFTAMTVGGLMGAIIGGQILHRVNCRLYIAVMLSFFGASFIAFPWADSVLSLMILAGILGLFQGALDCGKNTTALLLWGWDGAIIMQAYYFIFAIGTIVSAWIAAPFIVLDDLDDLEMNFRDLNLSSMTTVSDGVIGNRTLGPGTPGMPETRVQYSYLIVGVYFLVSAAAFAVSYGVWYKYEHLEGRIYDKVPVKEKREVPRSVTDETNGSLKNISGSTHGVNECKGQLNGSLKRWENNTCVELDQETGSSEEFSGSINRAHEPMWFRIPMMIFMMCIFATLVGLEVTFASFLMTFAVRALDWPKQDGIAVTAVFRASLAAARGLSICLAAVVTPTKLIVADVVLLLSACVLLCLFVCSDALILWIGSGMVGFGMGSLYASSMSWVGGQMRVTARAGSTFVTGSQVGILTVPALVGFLFDASGPFWFLYSCLIDTILLTFTFVVTMTFARCYHNKMRSTTRSDFREVNLTATSPL